MLLLPVVLLNSALTPLAVLLLPVVLLKSALTPVAVFCAPVLLKTRASNTDGRVVMPPVVLSFIARVTDCRVEVTGGVAHEDALESPKAVVPLAKAGGGDTVLRALENRRPLLSVVAGACCRRQHAQSAPIGRVEVAGGVARRATAKPVAVLDAPVLLTSA